VVVVVVSPDVESSDVSWITSQMITAISSATSAPSATSAAGLRYQGCGSSGGGAPPPGGSP
jgi:hypothetical protein